MVAKETVSGNGRHESPTRAMSRGMADVAHDLTHIADLQARLFAADLRQSLGRVRSMVVASVVGVCLLLAALPVGLLGVAYYVATATDWNMAAALAATAGAAILVACVLLFVAWRLMIEAAKPFERSSRELARNVEWLKRVFRPSSVHSRDRE